MRVPSRRHRGWTARGSSTPYSCAALECDTTTCSPAASDAIRTACRHVAGAPAIHTTFATAAPVAPGSPPRPDLAFRQPARLRLRSRTRPRPDVRPHPPAPRRRRSSPSPTTSDPFIPNSDPAFGRSPLAGGELANNRGMSVARTLGAGCHNRARRRAVDDRSAAFGRSPPAGGGPANKRGVSPWRRRSPCRGRRGCPRSTPGRRSGGRGPDGRRRRPAPRASAGCASSRPDG